MPSEKYSYQMCIRDRLIALANEAVAASAGNVVVIEKGAKLTYDVTHKARPVSYTHLDVYKRQG